MISLLALLLFICMQQQFTHRPSVVVSQFTEIGYKFSEWIYWSMSACLSVCLSFYLPVSLCSVNFLFVDFLCWFGHQLRWALLFWWPVAVLGHHQFIPLLSLLHWLIDGLSTFSSWTLLWRNFGVGTCCCELDRVWRLVEMWKTGSAKWRSRCLWVFASLCACQWQTMNKSRARIGFYSIRHRSVACALFATLVSCLSIAFQYGLQSHTGSR